MFSRRAEVMPIKFILVFLMPHRELNIALFLEYNHFLTREINWLKIKRQLAVINYNCKVERLM